ncbi:hypothetical protein FF1_010002 [Malus domestica]|uniref:uncharacterized protein LOC126593615 n=1 Tax=Malus sylvestris TaxID=3752 RepID=UPI0021AC3440|nr:uncharacterized protein LOC126593615 [Malus sylvestris]
MEDVIPESESLLIPVNLRHTNGGANTEGRGAVNGREGTAKGSIRREQGEDKEVDAEKKNMNGGTEEEEEKGSGGIITHLTSIVLPRSGSKGGDAGKRKGKFEVDDVGNEEYSAKSEREGGGENGNGGVFSNLISNFFNPSNGGEGGGRGEVDEVNKAAEKVMKDIGNKRMKTAKEVEEGGGGGGIIDNIVSHLPISLPDDAAPTMDEASILITSIVQD